MRDILPVIDLTGGLAVPGGGAHRREQGYRELAGFGAGDHIGARLEGTRSDICIGTGACRGAFLGDSQVVTDGSAAVDFTLPGVGGDDCGSEAVDVKGGAGNRGDVGIGRCVVHIGLGAGNRLDRQGAGGLGPGLCHLRLGEAQVLGLLARRGGGILQVKMDADACSAATDLEIIGGRLKIQYLVCRSAVHLVRGELEPAVAVDGQRIQISLRRLRTLITDTGAAVAAIIANQIPVVIEDEAIDIAALSHRELIR